MKNRYLMMLVTGFALAVLLWAIVNVLSGQKTVDNQQNLLEQHPTNTNLQEETLIAPARIEGGLWRDQMIILQGTGEVGGTITLQADLSTLLREETAAQSGQNEVAINQDKHPKIQNSKSDNPLEKTVPELPSAKPPTINPEGMKTNLHLYGKTIVQENGHWDLTIPKSKFPKIGSKNQIAIASVLMTTLDGRQVRSDQSLIIAFQPMLGAGGKGRKNITDKATNNTMIFNPNVTDGSAAREGQDKITHQALLVLTAPGANSRVLVAPYEQLPNIDGFLLEAIDYDNSGGVIFSGTSSKNGKVRVYANDNLVGESHVDRTGRWSLIFGNILPLGRYNLTLERVAQQPDDQTKDNLSRLVLPFFRVKPLETARNLQAATIDYNDDRIQIIRALYGGGHQYTVIYSDRAIITE